MVDTAKAGMGQPKKLTRHERLLRAQREEAAPMAREVEELLERMKGRDPDFAECRAEALRLFSRATSLGTSVGDAVARRALFAAREAQACVNFLG